MTNAKAIEILREKINEEFSTDTAEAFCMAISALDKQEGKKPKHIDKNGVFDGNWIKVCPTCGKTLMERITTEEISYPRHYNMTGHCWCGQRIDWSDEYGMIEVIDKRRARNVTFN